MRSFLTGKVISSEHPAPNPDPMVVEPMTAEAHLAAMRRLLDAASSGIDAATLVAAAQVHATAAQTAPKAQYGPFGEEIKPASRVRINTGPGHDYP